MGWFILLLISMALAWSAEGFDWYHDCAPLGLTVCLFGLLLFYHVFLGWGWL